MNEIRPRGPGGSHGWRDAPWDEMHSGLGWGGWLLGVLLLLLLATLIVLAVLLLARTSAAGRAGTGTSTPEESLSAQQVLDERYARGEIDEIEYLHRKAVLRGS